MVRYKLTSKGFTRIDTLTDKLRNLDSRSSAWYTTISELQVLDSYMRGETRRITPANFKPSLVSAFDRLLKDGYLKSAVI